MNPQKMTVIIPNMEAITKTYLFYSGFKIVELKLIPSIPQSAIEE